MFSKIHHLNTSKTNIFVFRYLRFLPSFFLVVQMLFRLNKYHWYSEVKSVPHGIQMTLLFNINRQCARK